ncbi:TetR/AcrR family transcriptional regulator [Conexibacter woesei]|uniref:TetR/AcrR family transcriptional regulator n=1 Tax=Conexibacter woesei TaxID=191495 RepID=UPI0003F9B19E|nr:TetR/AcrR family transcriptional regulator [Conexibacter woesei]
MARRLSPEERREQLVRAAMGILAREGYEALSFEAVARDAQVTRNLLYHYFPGGVVELFRACAEQAGFDLVADWTVDDALPLDERRARNFGAMAHHAGTPTDAWLVSRITVASADPVVRATTARNRDHLVSAMALNAFGTADPPPLARAALASYQAFAESLLDRAREERLDGAEVVRVLEAMLEAAVSAVAAAR